MYVQPFFSVCAERRLLAETLADALELEVIYMVMLSFTSEMHLPQHCQIGLIHIGQAPVRMHVRCVFVCVCVCVCVFVLSLCVVMDQASFSLCGCRTRNLSRWIVCLFLCLCIGWKIYSDPIRSCNS